MIKDLSAVDLGYALNVLIIEDNDFLLVKRGKAWPDNEWALPGHMGKADNLESLIQKIKEDIGVVISIGGVIETYCAYNRPSDRLDIITVFRGKIESGAINPSDSLEVNLFPAKVALALPIGKISQSAKMAIFDYIAKGVIMFSDSPK